MSDEAKENLAFYEPLWNKWKNFVMENRNVDMQWVADESYKDLISGKTTTKKSGLDWGLVDVVEEDEEFDLRMIEKFGGSKDDEDELNLVYYRPYLASFDDELPSKSKNEIKVVTVDAWEKIKAAPKYKGIPESQLIAALKDQGYDTSLIE